MDDMKIGKNICFEYMGFIIYEDGEIAEDDTNMIKAGWKNRGEILKFYVIVKYSDLKLCFI